MAIMVAGGLTFAVPGAMPVAHAANANLFVSAENETFENHMTGPQVIEVVIIDPSINDTDEAKGEPDVTVNGKILRMSQAVDGNWYGYFADRKQAVMADHIAGQNNSPAGTGLDFGTFCAPGPTTYETLGETELSISDTRGIAIPSVKGAGEASDIGGQQGTADGAAPTAQCVKKTQEGADGENVIHEDVILNVMNVLREAKEINTSIGIDSYGQIGIDSEFHEAIWPFVQLYDLNPYR